MPTLKVDQYKKWSAALAEGWKFDAQRYIMWGDKSIYTDGAENENGVFYRVELDYTEEKTGNGWTARATGLQIATVKVQRYTPAESGGGFYSVVSILRESVGEKQTKKNYNYLVKLSASLDTADYIRRAAEADTGKQYNDLWDFSTDNAEAAEDAAPVPEIIEAAEDNTATETGTEAAEIAAEATAAEKPAEDSAEDAPILAEPENAPTVEEAAPEVETPAEDATPAEANTATAEAAPADTFAALATAYFTGRSVRATPRAQKPTAAQATPADPDPDPEPTADPPAPPAEPPRPGVEWDNNALLSASARSALSAGQSFKVPDEHRNVNIFFSAPYSDNVRLVYYVSTWDKHRENIEPGREAKYYGFMIGETLYTAMNAMREKFSADIDRYLLEHIPAETDAAHVAANIIEEWERNRLEGMKEADYNGDARRMFFEGKRPTLTLYSEKDQPIDELIKYVQEPEKTIEAAALRYMCDKPQKIYGAWIVYNRVSAAYEAITADKANDEHKLKKIAAAITDQKTVRIDLTNGNTVKVEADAVKSMPFCGYISSWRVSACDRKYIPQTPYGRPDEIKVSDILKIWHGAKLLYVA